MVWEVSKRGSDTNSIVCTPWSRQWNFLEGATNGTSSLSNNAKKASKINNIIINFGNIANILFWTDQYYLITKNYLKNYPSF